MTSRFKVSQMLPQPSIIYLFKAGLFSFLWAVALSCAVVMLAYSKQYQGEVDVNRTTTCERRQQRPCYPRTDRDWTFIVSAVCLSFTAASLLVNEYISDVIIIRLCLLCAYSCISLAHCYQLSKIRLFRALPTNS